MLSPVSIIINDFAKLLFDKKKKSAFPGYRDKARNPSNFELTLSLKRGPWLTALKPRPSDKEKGFPPSSVQDLMPVGYQSNRETHPIDLPPDFHDPHGATVDWNVLIASPRGWHAGATGGRHPRSSTNPGDAARTHLFGSLMSNTNVTVTRMLMMWFVIRSEAMQLLQDHGFIFFEQTTEKSLSVRTSRV